ncbi:MAG: hypothetical protein M3487_09175, partial [Actinomycetota bacterium]|nr:hypothetical protein [Actinomycetota bacterium]
EESSAPATPPATTTEATAEPSAMAASPSLEEAVDAPATDTGPAVESPVERALRGESTIDRAGVGEDGTAPA